MFAGINGAGKSTVASLPNVKSRILARHHFNPDEIARQLRALRPELSPAEADLEAILMVENNVDHCISSGESFVVETVLSTDKYSHRIDAAKQAGYFIGMFYITLSTLELARFRVQQRVRAGGHDVPAEKITKRWSRSHQMLGAFVPKLDFLEIYDNSVKSGPTLVAKKTHGGMSLLLPGRLPAVEIALAGLFMGEEAEGDH
jgi:predicted ABC-type ATPase